MALFKCGASIDLGFQVISTNFKLLDLLLSLLLLVFADSQKIKSNLRLSVFLDPSLNLVSSLLQPVFLSALAKGNRSGLEAIKFIKLALIRDIPDEVENIIVFPL